MNTTVSINLANVALVIDQDAYEQLKQYLDSIRNYFEQSDDNADEIVEDIEQRVAELLTERLKKAKGREVVTSQDITAVIDEMGTVADITGQEAEASDSESSHDHTESSEKGDKRLMRDVDNKVIEGVCAGLAAYFGIDVTWVRIIFLVLIFVNGIGILAYILLWIAMPPALTAADKIEMRGKQVNVSSISARVKEGVDNSREPVQTALSGVNAFLAQLFSGLKKVLLAVLPVISIIAGIIVLLVGGAILFAATSSAALLVAGSTVDYGGFPLDTLYNFGGMAVWFVLSVVMSLVILSVLIFLLGMTLVKRKAVASSGMVVTLVVILTIGGFAALSFGLASIPQIEYAIDEYESEQEYVAEQYMLDEPIVGIDVSGGHVVNVLYAEETAVIIEGGDKVVSALKPKVRNNVLSFERDPDWQICIILCWNQSADITVYTPQIEQITASGATDVHMSDYPEQTYLNVELSGASELYFDGSIEDTLVLYASGASYAHLAGTVEYAEFNLSGASEVDANGSEVLAASFQEVQADLSGASELSIYVEEELDVIATGASDVTYYGTPKITQDVSGASEVTAGR